jgi:hypothetical protein
MTQTTCRCGHDAAEHTRRFVGAAGGTFSTACARCACVVLRVRPAEAPIGHGHHHTAACWTGLYEVQVCGLTDDLCEGQGLGWSVR